MYGCPPSLTLEEENKLSEVDCARGFGVHDTAYLAQGCSEKVHGILVARGIIDHDGIAASKESIPGHD